MISSPFVSTAKSMAFATKIEKVSALLDFNHGNFFNNARRKCNKAIVNGCLDESINLF